MGELKLARIGKVKRMLDITIADTIKLEAWGFGPSSDDGPYDSCQGIRLRGFSQGNPIGIVWESCLYDSDDFEKYEPLRYELSKFLVNNGIVPDLFRCQDNCIYDWEYEFSFTTDRRSDISE